jgi:methylthioribose-1-phosphate isomerase
MKINGKDYRTIWIEKNNEQIVKIIDQRYLPYKLVIEDLKTVDDFIIAIKDMHVRGAGLIGATAGYAMYIAVLEALKTTDFEKAIKQLGQQIAESRPTAVNLSWAVNLQLEAINRCSTKEQKIAAAYKKAHEIADDDAKWCQQIGKHGVDIINKISQRKKGQPVNVLTHCNAGWLAFVDYGSATAPIYQAFNDGIPVHVWVDETRPRNQGARLTAWELKEHGVPHTVIADNTGGHLMQHGMVDLVITGTDRTTWTGDVANKIGTYLKALAAKDNDVPFYVALPSSTFDWTIEDGVKQIPIEQRDPNEVKYMEGQIKGEMVEILLTPEKSPAANYAFDVTPNRLITGLITERGICEANQEAILKLYPEKKNFI